MTVLPLVALVLLACQRRPDLDLEGWARAEGDCDDGDVDVHPGAYEDCNGRDDDCDGDVDEGLSVRRWEDVDCDGYGRPGAGEFVSCLAVEDPVGCWVDAADLAVDCDDDDASVAVSCDDTGELADGSGRRPEGGVGSDPITTSPSGPPRPPRTRT